MTTVGASLDTAIADLDEGKGFSLGDVYCDEAGKEFVFVQADGAIVAGDVVIIDSAYQADQIDTTSSAGKINSRVGVAVYAFADNEYGFVQVKGAVAAINAATGATADTKLNSTATAGRLDDDGSSGAESIHGLYITATAASNTAPGVLLYPVIDATL